MSASSVPVGRSLSLCADHNDCTLHACRNGLDSSVALTINKALRAWASDTKGTVVASLLQPIPEIFELFDQLVLLQDGFVVYAGPRDGKRAGCCMYTTTHIAVIVWS